MQEIYHVILANLAYVAIGAALFIACYVSNMAFGIWYNVKVLEQKFEWAKIKESIIKIIFFVIGTVLMCIAITIIPVFCEHVGIALPEEYIKVFQGLVIVTVFIYSAVQYLLQAFDKFKKILNRDNSAQIAPELTPAIGFVVDSPFEEGETFDGD